MNGAHKNARQSPNMFRTSYHLIDIISEEYVISTPRFTEKMKVKNGSVICPRPLEKRMATYSSILAWRLPRTEEPGGVTRSQTRLSD